MSAFWKGSEVSVAEVFHILVDCRRGCVIAIDRHLFEQRKTLFQIRDRRSIVTSHRSEEHTSELQSQSNLVCRLLLEKKKQTPDKTRLSKRPQGTSVTLTTRI